MMHIQSPANPQVKLWRNLLTVAGRKEHGLFLAEGEHMASEAVAEGAATALMCDATKTDRYAALLLSGLPCYLLAPPVFSKISDTKTPQGIMALCRLPDAPMLPSLGQRIVALNRLQDPGNVGTILRTMDAAGFTGLILDAGTADPYGLKALRASMGAVFRIPVLCVPHLAETLKQLKGFHILAGDLQGQDFYQLSLPPAPLCLMIGSEGAGLDKALLPLATHRVRLPMPGKAESLNAAVAAAIMMYDFVRREG